MDEIAEKIAMLERRISREIESRKQSEAILNERSSELYQLNIALQKSNESLDLRVQERTQALEIAKKQAEQQSAINKKINDRFKLAMLASTAGIWEKNMLDTSWFFSDRLMSLLSFQQEELIQHFENFSFVYPQDRYRLKQRILKHIKYQQLLDVECRVLTGSGDYKWFWVVGQAEWDTQGNVTRIVGSFSDINERVETAKMVQQMAHFDHLTQIPNRVLFTEQLDQVIEQASIQKMSVGVLLVDLNDFKLINDTLGHIAGDRLLQHVASTLQQSIHSSDLVARLGGDEFAIALVNIHDNRDLENRCRKILKAFERPLKYQANNIQAKISIGVALFPKHGANRTELLSNADLAMYKAKDNKSKGSQFYFCEQQLIEQRAVRVRIGQDIYSAIKNREFYMKYQPFVELAKGTHKMVESLVRWNHPTLGEMSPADFIPIAEQSGLIIELGELIIEMVVNEIATLMAAKGLGRLSINISAGHFLAPSFLPALMRSLDQTPGAAEHLCIEITESVVLDNLDLACVVIDKLHRLGLVVSLDDFGTGYSSLSYLQLLAVDSIKLDRSFIADLDTSRDRRTITESIIKLAHSLKLYVVAEGVENAKQLDYLRDYQCDYIQGNYFYQPMSAEELLIVQRDSQFFQDWDDTLFTR